MATATLDDVVKALERLDRGLVENTKKQTEPQAVREGTGLLSSVQGLYKTLVQTFQGNFKALESIPSAVGKVQSSFGDFLGGGGKSTTPSRVASQAQSALSTAQQTATAARTVGQAAQTAGQAGSAGQSAAAESAAGAAAGGEAAGGVEAVAATGPVGIAVAVIAALAALPVVVAKFGQSLLDSQKYLAEFSGKMALVFARTEVREGLRNQQRGEATGESAERLSESLQDLYDTLEPFTEQVLNFMNDTLSGGIDFITEGIGTGIDALNAVIKLLNKGLEELKAGLKIDEIKKPVKVAQDNDTPAGVFLKEWGDNAQRLPRR